MDIKSLKRNYNQRSGDVRCAFLVGKDSGDANGAPVYMYTCAEYETHYWAWLAGQSREVQQRFAGADYRKDVVIRLEGNLCGRRPAGATFRDEFEAVMTVELKEHGYHFERGTLDPCVYSCKVSDVTVVHHVDDTGATGPDADLDYLHEKTGLGAYLGMKIGKSEVPGTVVH